MTGNRKKITFLIGIVWLGCMLAVGGYYRTNQNILLQIEELGNSVHEFRSAIQFDTAFRSQRSNDLALNLQMIYALRLQLEGQYQTNLLTPDISHLLYTTDRFIEQAQNLLDNELALYELLEQLKSTRLKYSREPSSQARFFEVGTYIFEAMYSSESSSPQVYRALDRLFAQSMTLVGDEQKDLQRVLAKTSSVLNGYAQGNYLVDKLVSHSVHQQITIMEDELYQASATLFWASIAVSGLALFGVSVLTNVSQQTNNRDQKDQQLSEAPVNTPAIEPTLLTESEAEVVPVSPPLEVPKPVSVKQAPNREIDLDRMLESLSGDRESVQMLLEVFVQDHKGDDEAIRLCLRDDPELAQRKAHSLKGVGGSLGASGLREAADELERAIKSNDNRIEEVLERLSTHLNTAIQEAEAHLLSENSQQVPSN